MVSVAPIGLRMLIVSYGEGLGGVEKATERVFETFGSHHTVHFLIVSTPEMSESERGVGVAPSESVSRRSIRHYGPTPRVLVHQFAEFNDLRRQILLSQPDVVIAIKSPMVSLIPNLFLRRDFALLGIEHRRAGKLREGGRIRDGISRWQHVRGMRRCDALVVLDEELHREALALGVGKPVVIRNPVPDELFRLDLERPRENTVLFIGRLNSEKRVGLLVEAWLSLPRQVRELWTLRIIGEGPDRPELERLVSSHTDHSVQFVGARKDVTDDVRHAAWVCLPSLYELQPLVALEALAAGVPLLISEEAAQGKWFRTAPSVVAVESSVDGWREALLLRLVDKRVPSAIDLQGGRSYVDRCRTSVVSGQWLSLIAETVGLQ